MKASKELANTENIKGTVNPRGSFEKYLEIVQKNEMSSKILFSVPAELSREELPDVIISRVGAGHLVKFASEVSAVTHIFKHENSNLTDVLPETKNYVTIANDIIFESTSAQVTLEGLSQNVEFHLEGVGKVVVLVTQDSKVLLKTYIEAKKIRTRGA
jgi:hypothetical protein